MMTCVIGGYSVGMGWRGNSWVGDPVWMVDVLRSAGLRVIEEPGWMERGHGDFLDLRGVLCHHTAGGGPNDYIVVRDGRPGLPGPLAQLVLEPDGTYRAIAVGVCWHAGRGSWPGWPTNNANYHVIGIEAVNDGTSGYWPPAQYDAYVRGSAALLAAMRRGMNDCVGHKEYSSEGKIDPFGIDMHDFRADVNTLLATGDLEDDMPSAEDIARAVWAAKVTKPDGTGEQAGILLGWVDQHAADTVDQLAGPKTKDQRTGTKGPLKPTGWPQLDPEADEPPSLVDGVASKADVARVEEKLDRLLAQLDNPGQDV